MSEETAVPKEAEVIEKLTTEILQALVDVKKPVHHVILSSYVLSHILRLGSNMLSDEDQRRVAKIVLNESGHRIFFPSKRTEK